MGLRTDLFIFVDLTKPISLPNLYRMDGLGEGMGGRQPAQRRLSRARRLALPSLAAGRRGVIYGPLGCTGCMREVTS